MRSPARKRILIVDDSAVVRSLLRKVIALDNRLEVVGTAADGESAVTAAETLKPDLILLDVEMPVLDGLGTLRRLRAREMRMPVIMCSSLTRFGASVTIEALAHGAADYVTKPVGQAGSGAAVSTLFHQLIPKIEALVFPVSNQWASLAQRRPSRDRTGGNANPSSTKPAVVIIGVSTGGPAALAMLLPLLPASFPLPVLIVQHMPQLFTKLLAERLASKCNLRVQEAEEGRRIEPGSIWIAKGDWHLEITQDRRLGSSPTLHLASGPLENHCRPAVDVLFRSAASVYGAATIAIVLTGMGSDGLAGARSVRNKGGFVVAQDEASSTVWGMPGAVVKAGVAHRILSLQAIGNELLHLTGQPCPRIGESDEVPVA